MLGRTHDLAIFTSLSYLVATQPLPEMSLATAITSFGASFVGALIPDIDQSTADIWKRLPAGTIFSRILAPLLGGHRFISHSFLGLGLFGFLSKVSFEAASQVVLVDMKIVWAAFMIGYLSHLLMDTLTKEGVPWLFPIPTKFGFPPFRFLRIKTGGVIEKILLFPGLFFLNFYIYYNHYGKFIEFIKNSLR